MSEFYTRDGDDGYTGLLGEGRVPKHDARLEAVGALDEASSALGLSRALAVDSDIREALLHAQRDLYHVMAEVAATLEAAPRFRALNAERVLWLEGEIDRIGRRARLPQEFLVAGDAPSSSALDLARAIVRRAERRVALLAHDGQLGNAEILRYLNRLSSLCFVMEVRENELAGFERPTPARGTEE